MSRGRGYKRHQQARHKQRAYRLFKDIWQDEFCQNSPRLIAIYANNRRPCSCWMCKSNKTRIDGLPIRDLRRVA